VFECYAQPLLRGLVLSSLVVLIVVGSLSLAVVFDSPAPEETIAAEEGVNPLVDLAHFIPLNTSILVLCSTLTLTGKEKVVIDNNPTDW